jgi:hypothetical protein
MAYAYSVFFNGVLHSRHARKGEALDAAYRHVNTAQKCNYDHAHKHPLSIEVHARAANLSKLMGVMASLIPDVRRSRSRNRFCLLIAESGESITVRRDTY